LAVVYNVERLGSPTRWPLLELNRLDVEQASPVGLVAENPSTARHASFSWRKRSIDSESASSTSAVDAHGVERNAIPWQWIRCGMAVAPAAFDNDQPGPAHGRFQRAIHRRDVLAAETAALEMGALSLADALTLCELLAVTDPKRYERSALRWLHPFIDERLPLLTEVAPAAAALAELRDGKRFAVVDALKRIVHH
jgi:hypothetical protein